MPERTSCEAAHHHVEYRARIAGRAVLAQPAEDVLDVHHRVVDQRADGDGDAAERHGVDGQPGEIEDRRRGQDRNRVSRSARSRWSASSAGTRTARRPPRWQPRPARSCTLRIDVSMKFACRKMIWSALMPCGRLRVELRQCACFDLAGQRDGVDVRLLLDRDHHGGLAHVAAVAALDLGREFDVATCRR